MKKKLTRLIFLVLLTTFFNGCSANLWYEGLREMERSRCNQIEDSTERQKCMDEIDEMSYDQYQKEREISIDATGQGIDE